jgi:hypothetical protein
VGHALHDAREEGHELDAIVPAGQTKQFKGVEGNADSHTTNQPKVAKRLLPTSSEDEIITV